MSHARFNPQPIQVLAVTFACLFLLGCVQGCPQAAPRPPGINAQLLPGVWRATQHDFDLIWTFAAEGGLRFQLQPRNVWLQLIGGGFDVKGRWRLAGDQLTIELTETPPNFALFGENWTGQAETVRIIRLTDQELQLAGFDDSFRRSLAFTSEPVANNGTSSAGVPAANPAYWAKIDELESLLNDDSVNSFAEQDFLWFIYESNAWMETQTYLRSDGHQRSLKVVRQHLSQRGEFRDFVELFQLGEEAEKVKAEIAAETRRLEVDFQSIRNDRAFAAGFNSGFEGGNLGAQSYAQGATGKEALLVGAGYTLVSTLIRFSQNERELTAAKREALEKLAERSRRRLDELAVSEQAARQRIRSLVSLEIDGGEAKGLVHREVDRLMRQMATGNTSNDRSAQIEISVEFARGILELRRRIPAHPMYHRWRAECAYWAAFYLEGVALQETEGKAWGTTPSKLAEFAVRVWDLALKSDPDDTHGFIRAHRACSLALAVLRRQRHVGAEISAESN